jgi:acyl carrier protein
MTDDQIRNDVLATLQTIAPEVAGEALAADRPLRDQVDLDSMDWLNVIVGLHERFGVDIPEADYAKLVTLDDIVAYLRAKPQGRSPGKGAA